MDFPDYITGLKIDQFYMFGITNETLYFCTSPYSD